MTSSAGHRRSRDEGALATLIGLSTGQTIGEIARDLTVQRFLINKGYAAPTQRPHATGETALGYV